MTRSSYDVLRSALDRHKVLREITATPRGGGLDIGLRDRPFARLEPSDDGLAIVSSADGATVVLVNDTETLVDWLNVLAQRARGTNRKESGK